MAAEIQKFDPNSLVDAQLSHLKEELKKRFAGAWLPTALIDSAFKFFAGIPEAQRPTDGKPEYWWTFCLKCGYCAPVHAPSGYGYLAKDELETIALAHSPVPSFKGCGSMRDDHSCSVCDDADQKGYAERQRRNDAREKVASIAASALGRIP